ncbi:hypothetical protein SADUNF_Sadunf19G0053800 [Salix dunnii]|uniref:Uncharacterized protein n=1 Tax=Salix dunnii TaxID=1413687 RepID=A0A835J5M8_9ROSI|nr:hypothetical protein SADUNF_Sadunf19G0053800 [Salix dunnii]
MEEKTYKSELLEPSYVYQRCRGQELNSQEGFKNVNGGYLYMEEHYDVIDKTYIGYGIFIHLQWNLKVGGENFRGKSREDQLTQRKNMEEFYVVKTRLHLLHLRPSPLSLLPQAIILSLIHHLSWVSTSTVPPLSDAALPSKSSSLQVFHVRIKLLVYRVLPVPGIMHIILPEVVIILEFLGEKYCVRDFHVWDEGILGLINHFCESMFQLGHNYLRDTLVYHIIIGYRSKEVKGNYQVVHLEAKL